MEIYKMHIIAATGYSEGKKDLEHPVRIILHKKGNEYVTHLQTITGNCIHGHYHIDRKTACEEFYERVREWNDTYKTGNISHVGPIEILDPSEMYEIESK
jgi:hypothetical protein